MKCEICDYECDNRAFGNHLRKSHNLTSKEYYDAYLKTDSEGTCIICSAPTKLIGLKGYKKYCSVKCSNKDPEIIKKAKQTLIEHYGEQGLKSQVIRDRAIRTSFERYGTENPSQSTEIKQKIQQTNFKKYGVKHSFQADSVKEKIKQTNLNKYGVEYSSQSNNNRFKTSRTMRMTGIEKRRNTVMEKYGVEHISQLSEVKEKKYETYRKNNTFNTSSLEEYFISICNSLNIGFKSQGELKDPRYPYNYDFYLLEQDLFIEINGNWTHGGHWYDEFTSQDILKLSKWNEKAKHSTFYQKAIEVWAQRDVEKRNKARENNINYVVLWSKEDIDMWFSLGCPVGQDWKHEYSWVPTRILKNNLDWKNLSEGSKTVITIAKKAQFDEFYKRELKLWNSTNVWNLDRVQINLFHNRLKYIGKNPCELTDLEILRGLSISGKIRAYSHFRNCGMKQFIKKYHITSIYDPCAGWGERLVTCAAMGIKYFGIDINEKVVEGHKQIIKHYKLSNQKTIHSDSSRWYVNTEYFDTVFTCPPYWNTEIYTKQGAENLSYEEFLIWWEQIVKNSNTKLFAYQINQKYKEDMNKVLMKCGYEFKEEIKLPNESSHFTRGKNGVNKKQEYESIQIFTRG